MDEREYLHMFEEEENHWWYVGMRAIVLSLLPPAGRSPNLRILDLGCGTGYTMGWFRQRYDASVAGIDYYPPALMFCRRRGEQDVIRADAAVLPFQGDSFDLVASFDVLSHLRDEETRARALKESLRVLKPGGTLLVRVAAYEWLRSSHDAEIRTFHRYGSRELRDAAVRAGFLPLRITCANTILFPVAALWRLLKKAGLAPRGSDVRSHTRGGSWANRRMTSILEWEAAALRGGRYNFRFGLSIFLIAARPGLCRAGDGQEARR